MTLQQASERVKKMKGRGAMIIIPDPELAAEMKRLHPKANIITYRRTICEK